MSKLITTRAILFTLLLALCLMAPLSAQTTITWWQFWTDPDIKPVIEDMVSEFEAQNPDISVELTDLTWANGHEKIAIAFASGTGPDVVELGSDWIAQFAVNDQLHDMTDLVAENKAEFDGWGMATMDSSVWAHPWILGTRVLFVNMDLMKRAGIPADSLPVGWHELLRQELRIDSLGPDIYGWGSNISEKHRLYKKFLPFFWSAGATIFTPDQRYCIISSMKSLQALAFYKMIHQHGSFVGTQRKIEDAFLDGKIGFILSGDWLLKRIKKENRNVNVLTTLMPGPPNQSGMANVGKSFLGGEFLAINAGSEHPEEAARFVKFITSPENQVRFCKANFSADPSSRTAQRDDFFSSDPNMLTFITQLRHAVHPPVHPDWVHIEEAIERAVERALFEDVKMEDAMRDAQIAITEIMKQ